jgi:hypothetical protein
MNAVAQMSDFRVDSATCKKVGSLAAYGMNDRAIADALLLSAEQLHFAKTSEEFKQAFSTAAQSRAERVMQLEEGWDALEEKALGTVLETLEHNRDPKFALHAAFVANKAVRRSPASNGRVIDASKVNNVIVLQLNQKFVQKVQVTDQNAVLDVSPIVERQRQLPRKSHDVPTPKKVSNLLGVSDGISKRSEVDEILDICKANGISVDLIENN